MINTLMNEKITGKILIIDDNPENLKVLGMLLKKIGHHVYVADNGNNIIKTISITNPDLILLDIIMPETDGYEVCRILKNDISTKNIPIIFISALHSTEDKIKAFRAGGVDYIEKPFEEDEVCVRIQTHLTLVNLYRSLEDKIKEEIEKNRSQQALMIQQSRLAQMGEMISMIAHQWRQPLNNISYMVQTVTDTYHNDKLNDKLMNDFESDVKEQLFFMSNTIDDFMGFFKPNKQKEDFNLSELIIKIVDLIKPKVNREKIKLILNTDTKIVINGFKNELGQVILNIINNSVDALSQKNIQDKFILVNLVSNAKVLITIEDNGGGIEDSMLDKVYDPYFSTKLEKNGTGLGLYMCKKIVEDHMNGELDIRNKQDGLSVTIALDLKD